MDEISLELSKDVTMIENFFKLASQPLIELFGRKKDNGKVQEEILNFMVGFVRSHSTFFKSLRKIVRYAAKNSR